MLQITILVVFIFHVGRYISRLLLDLSGREVGGGVGRGGGWYPLGGNGGRNGESHLHDNDPE